MTRKKYVQVGTGGRCSMYLNALCGDFKDAGELVGLCDTNQARMDYWNNRLQKEFGIAPLPTYKAQDFDRMIAELKPDKVIVTSMDRTHHKYICRAMELGCDVVTEKPMTIDAEKCQQIIDTKKQHRKRCDRYIQLPLFSAQYQSQGDHQKRHGRGRSPASISNGCFPRATVRTTSAAGTATKNNSGGLLVHKSTHHFDLVNWWIDSYPETVFAMGDLKFYGKENAEKRGITEFYSRARYARLPGKRPLRAPGLQR